MIFNTPANLAPALAKHIKERNPHGTTAADVGAVPENVGVKVYSRSAIGTSPAFDDPGVNGLFEIRASAETIGETGTKPFDSYGAFLNLKTPDNIAMMQIAGSTLGGARAYYIRAAQSGDVTMEGIPWSQLLTTAGEVPMQGALNMNAQNIWGVYALVGIDGGTFGTTLPAAGIPGRIFFKKVT